MKPGLKRSVIEHLESKQLDEGQLRRLEGLQDAGRPWLTGRRIQVAAVAAGILLLAGVVFLRPGGPGMAWQIADEVALNHLKQRPLEVKGTDLSALQSYFGELDFRLVQSSRDVSSQDRMLGGRYCSIQGVTAAQLRFRDDTGQITTLYQVPYDAMRFGTLPDIGSGGLPQVAQVRGLTVELWVEKGLLFALTRH